MDIHKFYPLQEPQPEELDEAFVDTTYNVLKRFGVLVQPGIVPAKALFALTEDPRWQQLMYSGSGQEFNIVQNGAWAFNVTRGLAFTRNALSADVPTNTFDLKMERIFIPPSGESAAYNPDNPGAKDVLGNPTPKSTGCNAIPVLPLRTYYVYITYLSCVDTLSADPSQPGNKYTLNPQTGQVQYVHYVDGYAIKVYINSRPISVGDKEQYLGTVITDATGIVSIDTSGRNYLSVPGSLVTANILTSLTPAGYTAGVSGAAYSFTDHINAVSDPIAVTVGNPHGTTMGTIPGLLDRFGIYSDNPQDFFTNGIIDSTDAIPGPFWASRNGVWISLVPPLSGQSVAVDSSLYDANSIYLSELYDGSSLYYAYNPPFLYAQFPVGVPLIRPTAMYFIFLEQQTIAPIYLPAPLTGLTTRALPAVRRDTGVTGTIATLEDMMEHPEMYLNTASQFPVAIVNFDSTLGVIPFTIDPQTQRTGTFTALDVRHYGTISEHNITHDRRAYEGLSGVVDDTLFRSNKIYGEHITWRIPGMLTAITTNPIAQTVVKKAGRIRRVTIFVDHPPTGTPPLTVNVTINGVGNSIFGGGTGVQPSMPSTRPNNCANYTGATGTGMIMSITEAAATLPDVGRIDATLNYVRPGDRLQLTIPTTPNNCGNDIVVTAYIE